MGKAFCSPRFLASRLRPHSSRGAGGPSRNSHLGNFASGRFQERSLGAKKFLGVSRNAPLGNFWGPCDFCISQNGPGHFRNGFLGIQKPARKSWERFGALRAPLSWRPKRSGIFWARRRPPKFPKGDSWKVGRPAGTSQGFPQDRKSKSRSSRARR